MGCYGALSCYSATLIMISSGVPVPPGPPAITSDLSGGVFEEGQTVHFTCSSSGGNPPPTVTWMKNGVELLNVAPGQTTTEGSTTRNVLSVTMDHSDHQANYTCFVYNTVNENSPLIAYKILNVRCELGKLSSIACNTIMFYSPSKCTDE